MPSALWTLVMSGLIVIGAKSSVSPYGTLGTLFDATRAHATGYTLDGWEPLTGAEDHVSLAGLASHVAHQAHVRGEVGLTKGPGFQKAEVVQAKRGITTEMMVERLASGATYVVLHRSSGYGFYGIGQGVLWAKKLLSQEGHSAHLCLTLEGYLPNLSSYQERKRMDEAFAAVHARAVTSRRLSAPTFVLQSADVIGRPCHPLHLQLAMHREPYDAVTKVLVGTPVVTVKY